MHIRKARHGDERQIWNVYTQAIIRVSAPDYPEEVINELLSPAPVANIEECLRQGIGTLLIARIEEAARDAGLSRLTVGSSTYAVPFYRACGFDGRSMRTVKGWRTGVELEEQLLEKSL